MRDRAPLAAPEGVSRNMLAYKPLRGTSISDHLDMLRGTAALAVMLGHLRGLFFVDLYDIAWKPGIPLKILYAATAFGHESVMIFFVLSGFLVGGSGLRGRIDGDWSWARYATNRLTRLWVVLIPALIVGSIWDHAGIAAFGTSGIYGAHAKNILVRFDVPARLSWKVMLGNALFVQQILTPTFGSNGALWSLSYEFWYYVLFPLIVLAYPSKKITWSTLWYVAAAIMVIWFVGQLIMACFLIWLLGALVNLAPEKESRGTQLWISAVACAGALVVVGLLVFKPTFTVYARDLVVGIAATALVFALLRGHGRSASGLYSRIARGLAGFSYTLYVVHIPALEFFSAWIVPKQRWQPDAVHLAMGAVICASTLGYAYTIARFTEHQTGAIRARVSAAIGIGD